MIVSINRRKLHCTKEGLNICIYICMWEGGKLGCLENCIFLSDSNSTFLIYRSSAKCQKVFDLKDRHCHFLVKGTETQALGERITCLNSLSNPLEQLRLQLPSRHAQASALLSSNTASPHQTAEEGCNQRTSLNRRDSNPKAEERCCDICDILHVCLNCY